MPPFDTNYFQTQKSVPPHKVVHVFEMLHIPLPQNLTILDVGCGKGQSPAYFAELGNTVYATDISRDALNHQNAQPNLNGHTLLSDLNGPWPLADDSLDLIFSHEVIEHFPATTLFFSEAHRVLKPQGRLVLKTPNGWDLKRALEPLRGRRWYGHDDPTHVCFYNVISLKSALKKAGFGQMKLRTGTDPLVRKGGLNLPAPPGLGHGLIALATK